MTVKRLILFIVTVTICCCYTSCSPGNKIPPGNKYIKILDPARKDNFTNEQLRNYVKKNSSPAIVVRSSGTAGPISSTSNTDRICSLLEMGLAKNGFDVRDRALFDNAASNSTSYSDLYDATHVDLLMEITSYSTENNYVVNGYYDSSGAFYRFKIQEGKKLWSYPQYIFRGMNISIKVTLLKENLVGGVYSYSYVPCSEESGGALITQMYPLRYRPLSSNRDINAVLNNPDPSGKIEYSSNRLDKAMEDFITDVVVPGMMDDIKGVYREPQSMNYAEVTPSFPEQNNQRASIEKEAPDSENKTSQENIASVPDEKNTKEKEGVPEAKNLQKEIDLICSTYSIAQIEWIVANPRRAKSSPFSAEAYAAALKRMIQEKEDEKNRLIENLSANKAQNSYGQISESINTIVDSHFKDLVKAQINSAKKKEIKEIEERAESIKTTYDKFNYLDISHINDICKFVSGSSSKVGLNIPEENADDVVFFMSMPMSPNKEDSIIFLFLDGNCIGAGTWNKGFFSSLDSSMIDKSFHEISVIGVSEKNNEKKELFQSIVQFNLKHTYIFSQKRQSRVLTELTLD